MRKYLLIPKNSQNKGFIEREDIIRYKKKNSLYCEEKRILLLYKESYVLLNNYLYLDRIEHYGSRERNYTLSYIYCLGQNGFFIKSNIKIWYKLLSQFITDINCYIQKQDIEIKINPYRYDQDIFDTKFKGSLTEGITSFLRRYKIDLDILCRLIPRNYMVSVTNYEIIKTKPNNEYLPIIDDLCNEIIENSRLERGQFYPIYSSLDKPKKKTRRSIQKKLRRIRKKLPLIAGNEFQKEMLKEIDNFSIGKAGLYYENKAQKECIKYIVDLPSLWDGAEPYKKLEDKFYSEELKLMNYKKEDNNFYKIFSYKDYIYRTNSNFDIVDKEQNLDEDDNYYEKDLEAYIKSHGRWRKTKSIIRQFYTEYDKLLLKNPEFKNTNLIFKSSGKKEKPPPKEKEKKFLIKKEEDSSKLKISKIGTDPISEILDIAKVGFINKFAFDEYKIIIYDMLYKAYILWKDSLYICVIIDFYNHANEFESSEFEILTLLYSNRDMLDYKDYVYRRDIFDNQIVDFCKKNEFYSIFNGLFGHKTTLEKGELLKCMIHYEANFIYEFEKGYKYLFYRYHMMKFVSSHKDNIKNHFDEFEKTFCLKFDELLVWRCNESNGFFKKRSWFYKDDAFKGDMEKIICSNLNILDENFKKAICNKIKIYKISDITLEEKKEFGYIFTHQI